DCLDGNADDRDETGGTDRPWFTFIPRRRCGFARRQQCKGSTRSRISCLQEGPRCSHSGRQIGGGFGGGRAPLETPSKKAPIPARATKHRRHRNVFAVY